jgi:hypothetical protein
MSKPAPRSIDVLWCSNQRQGRSNGWAFPPRVEQLLKELTADRTVCHFFGGHARWGLCCDIDPSVRPHVIGDAWLPPFRRDAFDVVILDPPYTHLNQQMKNQLLRAAAFTAKDSVIWFHTMWIAADVTLQLRRSWLVRVGDMCSVRCLQVFAVKQGAKEAPVPYFSRGPAIRYNRWLAGQTGLPFRAELE